MVNENVFRNNNNEYTPRMGLRPSENQQIYDEMLQKERELGAAIRFQRDKEGRYL